MARSLFSCSPSNSSDAYFRAWGLAVNTALAAVGLVQTADTGQIDWATVTAPAAVSTSKGYEIWRFADTLQATAPVFIKIEYGSGTGNLAYPAIWITIGTATDGAGTMTGLTTTRYSIMCNTSSTTSYGCRVSGDTNRMLIAMWADSANTTASLQFLLVIERTHDSAGADTSEGVLKISRHYYGGEQIRQSAYTFAGGELAVETNLGALVPTSGTGTNGTSVATYPIFCHKGVFFNPFMNVQLVFGAAVTAFVQISFTYYGATRLFIPLSSTYMVATVRGGISGLAFLIRDE